MIPTTDASQSKSTSSKYSMQLRFRQSGGTAALSAGSTAECRPWRRPFSSVPLRSRYDGWTR
ncbi:MAG: hypothetical protein U0599_27125 [Vicinamibacteria bacterium]